MTDVHNCGPGASVVDTGNTIDSIESDIMEQLHGTIDIYNENS